jgi:hypothetical protein
MWFHPQKAMNPEPSPSPSLDDIVKRTKEAKEAKEAKINDATDDLLQTLTDFACDFREKAKDSVETQSFWYQTTCQFADRMDTAVHQYVTKVEEIIDEDEADTDEEVIEEEEDEEEEEKKEKKETTPDMALDVLTQLSPKHELNDDGEQEPAKRQKLAAAVTDEPEPEPKPSAAVTESCAS